MRILCVIPARGGSKGLPRKNLRELAGRPLLAWTVEQAVAARHGLDVVVSTEDAEIAGVARAAGARVVHRPPELAEDTTPTEPVVRHVLDASRSAGHDPDAVMLLQPTSPVRLPGTLDRAVDQLAETGVDSLVGVVPQAPFLWAAGEVPTAAYDVADRPRRQDLTPQSMRYRETGSLYLTRPWVYDERDNRIGGRVGLFVMEELEGTDIDTELDLLVAERILLGLTSPTGGTTP